MAKGLIAKFYYEGVHQPAKSEKAGLPIFEDREYVKIIPIGDNKTIVVKEVTDEIRQRFPEEYAVFRKGVEQTFSGTPLTEWPIILPSQIALFNHFNVYTVQHVAELDDIAIGKIGPGTRDWVEKAKAFIAKATNSAAVQLYAVQNEEMKRQLAEQSKIIADLSAQVKAMGDGNPVMSASEPAIDLAEMKASIMGELMAQLRSGQAQDEEATSDEGADGEVKRRRGRPPKDEQAAA